MKNYWTKRMTHDKKQQKSYNLKQHTGNRQNNNIGSEYRQLKNYRFNLENSQQQQKITVIGSLDRFNGSV